MASVMIYGPTGQQLTRQIKTGIYRLPHCAVDQQFAVTFEGLMAPEVQALVDASIRIEQARTGDVLSPTEYRNRFSGLDIPESKP